MEETERMRSSTLFTTIGRRLWSAAAAIDIAMINHEPRRGREELQPARLNVMVWATVNIVTTLVTRQSAEPASRRPRRGEDQHGRQDEHEDEEDVVRPVRMWFTPSSTLDENVLYQLVSPRSIWWLRVSAVSATSTECEFSMTPASQSLPISRRASRPGSRRRTDRT